jgi:hypothetical protein
MTHRFKLFMQRTNGSCTTVDIQMRINADVSFVVVPVDITKQE